MRHDGGAPDGCPHRLRCSWELKALGDYHQHLLKMRLEGGLEGIEMGPILGRGSFGRGYKGTGPVAHRSSTCLVPHAHRQLATPRLYMLSWDCFHGASSQHAVLSTAGRWQGALVAIKIVEHSLKGAAAEIEGARESLLAASISHPNVVRTPTRKCVQKRHTIES